MSLLTALAIAIGVLGGLLTFLLLGPAAATNLQIWGVFIGAASFFHCGGGEKGLGTSALSNIVGAVIGWLSLVLTTQVLAGVLGNVPIAAGIAVGLMAFVLVLVGNLSAVAIPAMVYGFATVAAYALLKDGALGAIFAANMTNPLAVAIASLVLGTLYGFVAQKIAIALSSRAAATA